MGSDSSKGQYVSSGVSSFNNGDMSGTHSFTSHNGNVVEETTGNLPSGFFPSMFQSASALPGTLTTLILTIAVLSTIVAVFISLKMKKTRSPPKTKCLSLGSEIGLDEVRDGGYKYNDRIFPLSSKRPLAEAIWNSDLLLEELVVKDNLRH